MKEVFGLAGKVAIVTGGYTGIGRGIADALAEAGAFIVVGARNFDQCEKACAEISKFGVKTLAVKCDVGKVEDAEKLITETINCFGHVDILVNNAGVTGSAKSITDITDMEWAATQAVNVNGIFHCSRAAVREMKKNNRGKIINVTSAASFKALQNSGDYCVSKAGAYMLTKVLALELAPYNIQVNAICPGYFATDLNPKLLAYIAKNAKKLIPAGRMGNVNEIKGVALLLASAASDYVTGAAIPIDGGVLAAA